MEELTLKRAHLQALEAIPEEKVSAGPRLSEPQHLRRPWGTLLVC